MQLRTRQQCGRTRALCKKLTYVVRQRVLRRALEYQTTSIVQRQHERRVPATRTISFGHGHIPRKAPGAPVVSSGIQATRHVPSHVVESVRQHIERVAHHLINAAYDGKHSRQRYARVTRVHVMCILRSATGSKYSRWYRVRTVMIADERSRATSKAIISTISLPSKRPQTSAMWRISL